METIVAVGAYGRAADINDWRMGLDFFSFSHDRYFSIRDADYLRREGFSGIVFCDAGEPVFFVSLLITEASGNQ